MGPTRLPWAGKAATIRYTLEDHLPKHRADGRRGRTEHPLGRRAASGRGRGAERGLLIPGDRRAAVSFGERRPGDPRAGELRARAGARQDGGCAFAPCAADRRRRPSARGGFLSSSMSTPLDRLEILDRYGAKPRPSSYFEQAQVDRACALLEVRRGNEAWTVVRTLRAYLNLALITRAGLGRLERALERTP